MLHNRRPVSVSPSYYPKPYPHLPGSGFPTCGICRLLLCCKGWQRRRRSATANENNKRGVFARAHLPGSPAASRGGSLWSAIERAFQPSQSRVSRAISLPWARRPCTVAPGRLPFLLPTSSLAECDLQFGRYEGLVRSLVPNKDNHAMAAATQMVRGQPCWPLSASQSPIPQLLPCMRGQDPALSPLLNHPFHRLLPAPATGLFLQLCLLVQPFTAAQHVLARVWVCAVKSLHQFERYFQTPTTMNV